MPRWALGFFVIAIIASILGFGRNAAGASDVARICFFVFIAGFVLSLAWNAARRRRMPPRM